MRNRLFSFFMALTAAFLFVSASLPVKVTPSEEKDTTKVIFEKAPIKISITEKIDNLYQKFTLNNASMPSPISFRNGMLGYLKLLKKEKIDNKILTIVDFSLPSVKKRMWVLDMESKRVLFNTYVAHGQNTGLNMATKFSNINSSHQSSLGFYLTAETYIGKHGLSLRLDGLEKGFNSNARERYIVIHGADYATSSFIERVGRLGRSYGCPAVPKKLSKEIITEIKEKSCFFIYYPSEKYLENSRFLGMKKV